MKHTRFVLVFSCLLLAACGPAAPIPCPTLSPAPTYTAYPTYTAAPAAAAPVSTVEVTRVVKQTAEVTRVVQQEVKVTRIVERVVTTTPPPPAVQPPAAPRGDLPGTRDFSIVPRPPYSVIVDYGTYRTWQMLKYEYDNHEVTPHDLAQFYTDAIDYSYWSLSSSQGGGDWYNLKFSPTSDAPELMARISYVDIDINRFDSGEAVITLFFSPYETDFDQYLVR